MASEHMRIANLFLDNFIKMVHFLSNFCQLDENLDAWLPDNWESTLLPGGNIYLHII
jgi:hypothetical protein